jgi:hypothetical protein
MSEKKISIDMDLFKVSGKTRKKREKKQDGIKVKTPSEKKNADTLKKRSILKMIRQHQEDRYKKLFEEKNDSKSTQDTTFNKEFKEAQNFFQSLENKKQQSLNTTFKNRDAQSLLYQPTFNALSDIKNTIRPSNNIDPPVVLQPSLQNITTPVYGCLKNGTLPTFKTLINQTRKVMPPIVNNMIPIPPPLVGGAEPIISNFNTTKIMETKINDSIQRITEMKETAAKLQQLKRKERPKKMKRKKTFRRTYKVGKSKTAPKVSVLVSNKTIRNNTSTKSQLLKQVPIEEIKKFLIKRGLIKVGSITPNDVLRKMYESTVMICGEVQNHNPENLMYNFFNDK